MKNLQAILLLSILMFFIPKGMTQTWDEITALIPSDFEAGGSNSYGRVVAISGNYAVAATYDYNIIDEGAVYVYELGVEDDWTEVTKLTAPDGIPSDRYGNALAISGDYILVGVSNDDDDGTNSGAVYVYERDLDGDWIEAQKLTASDAAGGDLFGASVSLFGNYALIGANGNDGGGSNSGSAYLFERDVDGEWTEIQHLTAADAAAGDAFGFSVSISEDYAIISGHGNDDDGSNSGSAYIFERDVDDLLVEVQKLTASDAITDDKFGRAVDIHNGRVVIGILDNETDEPYIGAAYVFERDEDGTWLEIEKLVASDAEEGKGFGWSVAIENDYILIGSPQVLISEPTPGFVYIFQRDDGGAWPEVQKIGGSEWSESTFADLFGWSVDISENHLISGAPGTPFEDEFFAYIFQGCQDMTITVSATEVCEGDEVIMEATSGTGGTISWTDDVINGEAFTPPTGLTTYTVNGGEEDCSFQVEINVFEAPILEITATDTVVCNGDEITLSGDGAVSYDWDEEVVDDLAFTPPLGETTYTLVGTDDNGCENSATIDILVNALPEVIAVADASILCEGDELTLSGEGATTYAWDEGAVDGEAFTPPFGETTYTVIGTDDNGCENSDEIDILVNELPEVTASADETLVCEGDEITLTGSGATTYTWDEGATDGVAFAPPAGETTYTVTGIDDNDCEATDEITITVLDAPEVSIVTLDDDKLCLGIGEITLAGTPADGTFSGAGMTGFEFDADAAGIGTHTVYYTYENDEGCSATDSVVIQVVDCLGVNDLNNLSFNIYPNPFTDFATIAFNQELTEAHQIIVYDVIGQEVYRKENITGSQILLTKEELGTGVYFISLSDTRNQVFTAKLIVQ